MGKNAHQFCAGLILQGYDAARNVVSLVSDQLRFHKDGADSKKDGTGGIEPATGEVETGDIDVDAEDDIDVDIIVPSLIAAKPVVLTSVNRILKQDRVRLRWGVGACVV